MNAPYPTSAAWRALEAGFRLADWLFIPYALMWLNRHFKPRTRPLTVRETDLARSIFGAAIQYQNVRIDECARIGCRRYRFAYVGFQVINCWGKLSDPHFIHEMVHVWQYQRLGAVYIPRALWAQRTLEGYNYGGVEALHRARETGKNLLDFNLEQQGDIVADYYCLQNGWQPRWCPVNSDYLPVFEQIIHPCFRPEA